MIIYCIDVEGFEDQLEEGQRYRAYKQGKNSYLIFNGKGQRRWYGKDKFTTYKSYLW